MAFLYSIRFKIVLLFGAALAAVGIADLFWVEPRVLDRAVANAKEEQLTSARQLAANVELFMRGARAELEAMARSPTVVAMDKSRLDPLLERAGRQTPFFNYFFATDAEGRWVSYPREPELVGQLIPEANRAWVREVVDTRQTVFLDVVKSLVGTLVSGFATPVLGPHGEVVGILRGVFVVSAKNTAAALLERIEVGSRGHAFLVAGNGWLLAHPVTRIDYEQFSAMDLSHRPAVQKAMRGEIGVAVETVDGEPWVVAQAPAPVSGWGVVVEQPEADIVARVRRDAADVRRLFLGGFVGSTLLLLLSLQFVLRPLSRLVSSIAAGGAPAAETAARDEIGVLARQLSQLYEQLLVSREALRVSEEKYRNIVRQSVDGVAVIDSEGRLLEWNDALVRITGLASAVVLGRPLWEVQLGLLPQAQRTQQVQERLRARITGLLQRGHADSVVEISEQEIVGAGGELRTVQETIFPIRLAGNRLLGGIVRDVTETKQLEAQLRHTEKMTAVGQLAGGIAHDFNNQLGGIMGFADLLRTEVAHDPKLALFADNILRGARRSAELTAQLLAFARKGKYLAVEVDVHRLIVEVVSILTRSLDKRIVIEQHLRARRSVTEGDPTQLQSALLNLAVNARDAMPDGGRLEISTDVFELSEAEGPSWRLPAAPGSYLRIRVTDTGGGMTPEVSARIFEPFFTTKPPGQGTGMGLAAVYGTVRNHHGAIAVKSTPGQGTVFELLLPLANGEARAVVDDEPGRMVRGEGHVLVVDDEAEVREATALMLRRAGYDVSTCSDGRAALAFVADAAPPVDLVILDLVMPVMSGQETFAALQAARPALPVLLCSGYSVDGEAESLLVAGAAGFVQKPYRAAELAHRVQQALAAARARS